MKISNKLLLVLSSVTLLAGCTPPGEGGKSECPQCPECTQCETCKECEECKECPETPVEKIDPEQVELLNIAKNTINEAIEEAKRILTYSDALSLLEGVKIFALNELNKIEEFESEDGAIEKANEIIDEYSNGEYKDKVATRFETLLLKCLANVQDDNVRQELFRLYDRGLPQFKDGSGPFLDFVESIEYFYQEIKTLVESAPELTDYGKYKSEIMWEAESLLDTYNTYIDDDAVWDYVNGRFAEFDNVKSEEEARTLTDQIKADLYGFTLTEYKKGLCGDLDNFKASLCKAVSQENQGLVEQAIRSLEEDKEAIFSELTFEQALKNHDYNLELYGREFIKLIRGWGIPKLEDVYATYKDCFKYDTDKSKFNIEYGKAYSKIENNNSDILKIEGEIKQTIEDFKKFCEDLKTEVNKYRIEGKVYDAALTLLDSQTLTQYDYQVNVTTVVKIAKLVDNRYLLQVDCEGKSVYYDNFFQYIEDNTKELYVKFDNNNPPETIYKDLIMSEALPDVDYVFNEELHSYVYVDIDHNTTYIVQFEFGLPVSVKLYDNINEELLSESIFSDYNSTTVIIPEHDWNY